MIYRTIHQLNNSTTSVMPSFRINLKWAAMSEVVPDLYISGVTALKPNELKTLQISMIVNCTAEVGA